MKLYLSSYRITVVAELAGLLNKPLDECNIAIIPNAKDYKLPGERATSIDELITDLKNFELRVQVVDLREYDEENAIYEVLKDYEIIHFAGGNAFVLRSEIRRSGLEKCIYKLLESGIVYVGESAGAIVAGKSLAGAETADDPGFANEVITDGLSLLDVVIAPHADSPKTIEYINLMKKRYPTDGDVVYINDNQAYVVDDTSAKIVTTS